MEPAYPGSVEKPSFITNRPLKSYRLSGLFYFLLVPVVISGYMFSSKEREHAKESGRSYPLEEYIGYFLLGHLLGRIKFRRPNRIRIYLGGVLGYGTCLLGNLAQASPQGISLPMNGGYMLNHYFLAACLFVFFRTYFETHAVRLEKLSGPLEKTSKLVFGAYWVHVLVLNILTASIHWDGSLFLWLIFQTGSTLLLSFLFSAIISAVPVLRRMLA